MRKRFAAWLALGALAVATVTAGLPVRCGMACEFCPQVASGPSMGLPHDCSLMSSATPRLAAASRPAAPGPFLARVVGVVARQLHPAAALSPAAPLEAPSPPPIPVLRV